MVAARLRQGKAHPQCFRCLDYHPRAERYCKLAAEYETPPEGREL